jgi:hypothetical protein
MKKILLTIGVALTLLFASNSEVLAAINTYKVKSGDTQYRIAKRFSISVAALTVEPPNIRSNFSESNIDHFKSEN